MYTNCKILVVDDNKDAVDSLAELLKLWGYEVQTALDGQSALCRVKEFLPHIILLDIGLPGMNGYKVASEIRKNVQLNGSILIALTGYGDTAKRQKALASGFDHFFAKPADLNEFKSLIDKVCLIH